MIRIDKLVFNSFQVNTYLVYDDSGSCIIVDPACYETEEKQALSTYISQHGLVPQMQLNTHCHIDHILGTQYVKETYKIPFLANQLEKKVLEQGPLMGMAFGFNTEPFPPLDGNVIHGQIVKFGNSSIEALHVPGHSEGSLALYSKEGGFVITGDALFAGSIGRTDLPGGNYDTLMESIKTKLFTLPPETVVYPGHGPASGIGEEILSNPFFK